MKNQILFPTLGNLFTTNKGGRSRMIHSLSTFLLLAAFVLFGAQGAWGQIALRGSAISSNAATTNMSSIGVDKPTGVVSGDIMIVSILQNETDNDNGGLSSANLSGWTLIDGRLIRSEGTSDGNNAWYGTVLYRVANGTEGSSFTFTLPNGVADMALISIVAFSGVTATGGLQADGTAGGPFDVDPGTLNLTNTQSSTTLGITTESANSAIVMLSFVNNDKSFSNWIATNPSTLTELYDNVTSTEDDGSIGAAWGILAAAGSTGNGIVTVDNNNNQRTGAILLALKPLIPGDTYTTTYTSNGTFTVPNCVTSLTVEAWGGGGGGYDGNSNGGGKGGGGGGFAKGTISNASGSYQVVVGVGGAEDNNGTASTFGSTLVVADFGRGGITPISGGGAGGESNTGNVTTSNGGNGGNGNNTDDVGGGGGGAGGPNGAGVNGSNGASNVGGTGGIGNGNSGGTGGTGGDGDDGNDGSDNTLGGGGGGGGDNGSNGGDGGFPGGGGGGGEVGGGSGADGLVRVTYTLPSNPTMILTVSTASVCYSASTQNVTLVFSATTGCADKYSIDFTSGITDITDANLSGSPITITLPAGLAAANYTGILTVKNSTYGFVSSGYSITITITAPPSAGTLSGMQSVCALGTTTLSSTVSGGAWTSGATGTATINGSTGVVSGVSAGSATMTYTVTGSGGCANATATRVVTVTNVTTTSTLVSDDYVWNGKVSNDFTSSGNWSKISGTTQVAATSAPQQGTNVFIPNVTQTCVFNTPNILVNTAKVQNLTIEANGVLNMVSGSLDIHGNYSNSGLFTPGTGLVTFSGQTGNQTITKTGGETFAKIKINKASGNVILANNLTVSSELSLVKGLLVLGSNDLILGSANLVDHTAQSYIQTSSTGKIKRNVGSTGSVFFPVGNSTYNPAELTNTIGSDVFSVSVVDIVYINGTSGAPQTSSVVNRTWLIEEASAGGNSVKMKLYWNGTDEQLTSFNPINAFVAHYVSSSSMWDNLGGTVNNGVIESSQAVSSFSPFTISSSPAFAPLPVELMSLDAQCAGENVIVAWKTASEHNSLNYVVERSEDGTSWSAIQTVAAAGNSNTVLDYAIEDAGAARGLKYYRLIQTDQDGAQKIYGPVMSNCGSDDNSFISFPNPGDGELTLVFNGNNFNGTSILHVRDANGRMVRTIALDIQPGTTSVLIPDMELTPGVYYLQLEGDNYTSKVIKHSLR